MIRISFRNRNSFETKKFNLKDNSSKQVKIYKGNCANFFKVSVNEWKRKKKTSKKWNEQMPNHCKVNFRKNKEEEEVLDRAN